MAWLKAALQLVREDDSWMCEDDGWMREDGFGSHIPEAKKSLYGSGSFATETKRLVPICLGFKTEAK